MSSEWRSPPKSTCKNKNIHAELFTHLNTKNWRKKSENVYHWAEFALVLPGISAPIEQLFYFIDEKYYSLSGRAHWR